MDEDELQRLLADALPHIETQPYADAAIVLARAILEALVDRHGNGFAADVHARIVRRAQQMAAGDEEDRRDAPAVRAIAELPYWERYGITAAASSEDAQPSP